MKTPMVHRAERVGWIGSQISDWKKANAVLEQQLKGSKDDAQKLENALKSKVEQSELREAQKEAASLRYAALAATCGHEQPELTAALFRRELLAAKTKECTEIAAKNAELRKQMSSLEDEVDELRRKAAGLVPRKDFLDEKGRADAAR